MGYSIRLPIMEHVDPHASLIECCIDEIARSVTASKRRSSHSTTTSRARPSSPTVSWTLHEVSVASRICGYSGVGNCSQAHPKFRPQSSARRSREETSTCLASLGKSGFPSNCSPLTATIWWSLPRAPHAPDSVTTRQASENDHSLMVILLHFVSSAST